MNRIFLPCASGTDAFAALLLEQQGDLIRFYGHADMTFIPADAVRLAQILLRWAGPLASVEETSAVAPDTADVPLVQSLVSRLHTLFPPEGGWKDVESEPLAVVQQARDWCLSLAVVQQARDWCLSLAVVLEKMRQEQAKVWNDGR